jgi:hypothetical protein
MSARGGTTGRAAGWPASGGRVGCAGDLGPPGSGCRTDGALGRGWPGATTAPRGKSPPGSGWRGPVRIWPGRGPAERGAIGWFRGNGVAGAAGRAALAGRSAGFPGLVTTAGGGMLGTGGAGAGSAGALASGAAGAARGGGGAGAGGSAGAAAGRGAGIAGTLGIGGATRRSGAGSSCAGPVWCTTVLRGIGMEGADPRPARGGRIGRERDGAGGRSDTVSFAAGAVCFGAAADSAGLVGGAACAAGLCSSSTAGSAAVAAPGSFFSVFAARGVAGAAVELSASGSAGPNPNLWRRAIATSSSTELEWVFFSATPSSGSISRIAPGLTSSSLASSLMRIFFILRTPRRNPHPYRARTVTAGLTTPSRSTPPGLGPGLLFFN